VALHDVAWPFDGAALLSSNVGIPRETMDDPAERVRLLTALDDELSRIPGAAATALASALPGRGSGNWTFTLDAPSVDGRGLPTTNVTMVSPGYFGVLGTGALRGRLFDGRDTTTARPSPVNEGL
jgi:hypothetical protein